MDHFKILFTLTRRFPFSNHAVFKKWVDFVMQSNNTKNKKPKKITKFSSICCKHFLKSDFSSSQTRKFLKKNVVPSITTEVVVNLRERQDTLDDEPVEVVLEDPLSNDACGLCKNSSHATLNLVDDYYFGLIRKCLPLVNINLNLLQKLCADCIKMLENFSLFVDKVISSQCIFVPEPSILKCPERSIKVEPLTSFDEELKRPNIQVVNFTQQSPSFTQQKKCEILEIVDIKPFHFHQESYDDEDEIQILSPKQLKVELTDPDEDGSNELELIRNYVHISTVFLHDHNYTLTSTLKGVEHNVKTEFDDDAVLCEPAVVVKICNLCNKTFKTFKKYLIHKLRVHQAMKTQKSRACSGCSKIFTRDSKLRNHKIHGCQRRKIGKICTKVIERKMQKAVKAHLKQQVKRLKKSYSCPTCHKTFNGPKNLYQHKVSHKASFYSCSLCDKKFKRAHGLKQHVKSIHEKEKNFICPICKHPYLLKADMTKCRHSKLKRNYS